jgi:hypothetical protein
MRLGSCWWLVLGSGCAGDDDKGPSGEADTDTDTDADTDTDTDADTDTDTEPQLTVVCSAVDNTLRASCVVTADPPAAVDLRWVREDGLGPTRGLSDATAAPSHELGVLYLAPDTPYVITASLPGAPGVEASTTFTSGTPPTEVGSWLTVTGASSVGLVGSTNLCSVESAFAVAFDTETGALVWYQDIDPTGTFDVLNMIRFTDRGTVVGETGDTLAEVDLHGTDVARFPTDQYPGPWGLHHDVFDAAGQYYSLFQDTRGDLTLDPVVVLDGTGTEVYRWDPRDHLVVPPTAEGDFLHTNTVFVAADGDLLLSWLEQRTVARVEGDPLDPAFGEVLWKMTGTGLEEVLGNDFTIDWSDVPEPHFFARQHNVSIRRDGRLMLLDNLNGRGLVLTFDESALTAHVDAVYPLADSTCPAQGTTAETEAGDVFVACVEGSLREYDAATATLRWEGTGGCRNGRDARGVRWAPLEGGWELRLP